MIESENKRIRTQQHHHKPQLQQLILYWCCFKHSTNKNQSTVCILQGVGQVQ